MKALKTLLASLLLASTTTQGALYSSGTLDTIIPDGNPNGISSTINVNGWSPTLNTVSVLVNMSGGYNGDTYAYLSYAGTSVVLLNRIGNSAGNLFGSSTAGFLVTLSDYYAGSGDIHSASGASGDQIIGTYNTDRRTADPQLVRDTSDRGASLASFDNGNLNGNWTIFFADMAGGNSPSTLMSWSLEITAVPEPVNVALGIFGGVFLVGIIVRNPRVRNRVHGWRVAIVQWVDAV